MMRASVVLVLGNAVLWSIVAQFNHYLAPWDISIFVGGLCVAFAGLRLPQREGVRVLIATGAWFDAQAPVPFGLHILLFLFAHTLICLFRERLAREDTLVGLLVGAVTNLGIIIAISIALIHRNPALWPLWSRLSVDSLLSFCAVILIGPCYFAWQEKLLLVVGVSFRREQRNLG